MVAAVIVGGAALEAAAWWLVAFRGADVWRVTVPALVAAGTAALLLGPAWSPDVDAALAVGVGAASGVALYLATRAFVVVARPWIAFGRHSVAIYDRQGRRSLGWALLLSAALSAPGEEVFWRGLAQPETASALDGRAGVAALIAWAAFVVASLPSANLAIVAGAAVGGALWSSLGWWSGGALAPLASHALWTALMLAFPVVPRREGAA